MGGRAAHPADGDSRISPWQEMTARKATCSLGNCLFLSARVFLELFLPLFSRSFLEAAAGEE